MQEAQQHLRELSMVQAVKSYGFPFVLPERLHLLREMFGFSLQGRNLLLVERLHAFDLILILRLLGVELVLENLNLKLEIAAFLSLRLDSGERVGTLIPQDLALLLMRNLQCLRLSM